MQEKLLKEQQTKELLENLLKEQQQTNELVEKLIQGNKNPNELLTTEQVHEEFDIRHQYGTKNI